LDGTQEQEQQTAHVEDQIQEGGQPNNKDPTVVNILSTQNRVDIRTIDFKAITSEDPNISSSNASPWIHRIPAYGGYSSPLSNFLPPDNEQVESFSRYVYPRPSKSHGGWFRSLLASFMLSEVACKDYAPNIDWVTYVAALCHHTLTNLDSGRALVCLNAKRTLISILVSP